MIIAFIDIAYVRGANNREPNGVKICERTLRRSFEFCKYCRGKTRQMLGFNNNCNYTDILTLASWGEKQ